MKGGELEMITSTCPDTICEVSNMLKYSVLRYSPSIVSDESINLGVLVTSEDYAEFFYTNRFSMIHEFDDTLDIETVKILLGSISDEVKGDLTTINAPFDISRFIRYYCKEYCFSPVISVPYEDLENKVEEIRRIYISNPTINVEQGAGELKKVEG